MPLAYRLFKGCRHGQHKGYNSAVARMYIGFMLLATQFGGIVCLNFYRLSYFILFLGSFYGTIELCFIF